MPRAIFIDPHGDDLIIAVGGTQIQLIDAGWEIKQIQMTDGRHGSNIMDPETTKRVREKESERVREYLGIKDFYNFCVEDGKLNFLDPEKKGEVIEELKNQIEEYDADVVFIPGKAEGHPDHRAAYEIGHETIEMLENKPLEVHYVVWLFPFYKQDPGELEKILKANIDQEFDRKIKAVRMNESQEREGRYSEIVKHIDAYFSLIYSAYRSWEKKRSEIIAIPKVNEKYNILIQSLRDVEDVTEIFHGRKSEKIKA
ncbi:MAG: PIG-L family deacetylase [Candidatus Aenigmarchaeota archaeon]|nr:PIG-L family deacetylase [Candidatus Aenigmarchaeota archaeon]